MTKDLVWPKRKYELTASVVYVYSKIEETYKNPLYKRPRICSWNTYLYLLSPELRHDKFSVFRNGMVTKNLSGYIVNWKFRHDHNYGRV